MVGEVFVSYARSDSAYCTELVKILRSKKIPVWFDETIERGGRWAQELEARINACAAFIVVMSPSAASSDWVSREIEQAELRHRPMFPLLLAGERFFRLSDRQFDDVRTRAVPSDAFVERLRESVESYRPWIRLVFCVNCHQQFYWDDPQRCSYHPLEPVTHGNTGPREDYRDVWKYPCCGQVLLTAIDALATISLLHVHLAVCTVPIGQGFGNSDRSRVQPERHYKRSSADAVT
jgi:TIR domain-containing protein